MANRDFKPSLRTPTKMSLQWGGPPTLAEQAEYDIEYPREGDDSFFTYVKKGGAQLPATEAVISIIVNNLAAAPWYVAKKEYKETVLGRETRYNPVNSYHPLEKINRILDDPLPNWLNGREWREYFIRCAVEGGNSFAVVERGIKGLARRLTLAQTTAQDQYSYKGDTLKWNLQLYKPGGLEEAVLVDDSEVLRFHAAGFDLKSMKSKGIFAGAGKETIESARSANRANKAILRRATVSGQFIVQDENAAAQHGGQTKFQAIKNMVNKALNDSKNAGKMPWLPSGVRPDGNGFSTLQTGLIDELDHAVTEIARLVLMEPQAIGYYKSGVRPATNESLNSRLERQGLRPWADRLQAALTRTLIPEEYQDQGFCIYVQTSQIALGSFTERVEVAGKMSAMYGLGTINEAREVVGLDEIDGADRLLPPKGSPVPSEGEPGGAGGGLTEEEVLASLNGNGRT